MFNAFLARLDNDPTDPGDILWPEFEPAEISEAERGVRSALLGNARRRRIRFLRAAELTYLVMNSPWADTVRQADPRVTYTDAGLRELYRFTGTVVTPTGQLSPGTQLVFGTTPNSPEVAQWHIRLTAVSGSSVTAVVTDELGSTTLTIPISGDVSATVELPRSEGVITFYGAQNLLINAAWDVLYQGDVTSWIDRLLSTPVEAELDVTPILSPRLLRGYRAAPLRIDKIAAVAAALGGGR